jgi:ubiquinone/menaquinone biosynthesis C-methylase UbiE
MERAAHWENVYRTRRAEEVSWYSPHLERSLELIARAAPDAGARIIDVGGGASTLVDDLCARGYLNVAVLDISATALEAARRRLGPQAGAGVRWLQGDVTLYPFEPACFDLWHDRAAFHFLTDPRDRDAYVRQASRALKPGGQLVIATFGPEGPMRCSGLAVVRYGAQELAAALGPGFELLEQRIETHRTPAGGSQQFLYARFRLRP